MSRTQNMQDSAKRAARSEHILSIALEAVELGEKATHAPWHFAEMRMFPISRERADDIGPDGKVFWGYSITGSNEHGGSILPVLGSVHNFPTQCEANAALIAHAGTHYAALARAYVEVVGALKEWDRLSLVIESAVRNADPANRPAVVAAIKSARALTKENTDG